MFFHVLNRAVARLLLFEKFAGYVEFEREVDFINPRVLGHLRRFTLGRN
jgi:hypothetical protein